jgi:transposase
MAIMLDGCNTEEQRSVVLLFWVKGLNEKNINKDMFHVYGEKCLSRKAVHNWAKKFSRSRSKVADDARSGAEVAETTDKRLLCCGFRRTGKAMGQVYQCWWYGRAIAQAVSRRLPTAAARVRAPAKHVGFVVDITT